jgi:hypothetical protein
LRDEPLVHFPRLTEEHDLRGAAHHVFLDVSVVVRVHALGQELLCEAPDGGDVERPHRGVSRRVFEGEKRGGVRRPGEIEKARGRTVMLHQGQPAVGVLLIGQMLQEMVRLAAEDPQDPALLVLPDTATDLVVLEIPREGAVQGPSCVGVATERPVLEIVTSDEGAKVRPGIDPLDLVGLGSCASLGHR